MKLSWEKEQNKILISQTKLEASTNSMVPKERKTRREVKRRKKDIALDILVF